MRAEFTERANAWGGWAFGDLAIAVFRAVEVVGSGAAVVSVSVRQQNSGHPQVSLSVKGEEDLARLGRRAQSGEFVATGWRSDEDGWHAVVNGISLHVSAEREAS